MQIGIIGAGSVAQTFARKAIDAGHTVVFSNSRGPESLAPMIADFGASASAAPTTAAAALPVVLLAVPWPKVEPALRDLPAWHGQILIDATNAFKNGTPAGGLVDFQGGSSSEYVASLAPGARVVKALNTLTMNSVSGTPAAGGFRRALFVSGDDPAARNAVADLFESFGFAPVDLGELRVGARIQAVGGPIAGHEFMLPRHAPRSFPAFNGEGLKG